MDSLFLSISLFFYRSFQFCKYIADALYGAYLMCICVYIYVSVCEYGLRERRPKRKLRYMKKYVDDGAVQSILHSPRRTLFVYRRKIEA